MWDDFGEQGRQSVANLGVIPRPVLGVVVQHPNRIRKKSKKSRWPWGYENKEEMRMSRASELSKLLEQEEPAVVDVTPTTVTPPPPAEEPEPLDKELVLGKISSAKELIDGAMDVCISTIKGAETDDEIRMAVSTLRGAVSSVASSMSEKVDEQTWMDRGEIDLCSKYEPDDAACGPGCPSEAVAAGRLCPYIEDQSVCGCYSTVGESRKVKEQATFKIGDKVRINSPGDDRDGWTGTIVAAQSDPGIVGDWYVDVGDEDDYPFETSELELIG